MSWLVFGGILDLTGDVAMMMYEKLAIFNGIRINYYIDTHTGNLF